MSPKASFNIDTTQKPHQVVLQILEASYVKRMMREGYLDVEMAIHKRPT